jgi:hypothetical protein
MFWRVCAYIVTIVVMPTISIMVMSIVPVVWRTWISIAMAVRNIVVIIPAFLLMCPITADRRSINVIAAIRSVLYTCSCMSRGFMPATFIHWHSWALVWVLWRTCIRACILHGLTITLLGSFVPAHVFIVPIAIVWCIHWRTLGPFMTEFVVIGRIPACHLLFPVATDGRIRLVQITFCRICHAHACIGRIFLPMTLVRGCLGALKHAPTVHRARCLQRYAVILRSRWVPAFMMSLPVTT